MLGDMTVARSFEAHRDLLTSVENTLDTNTISRYYYVNDAAGRRTGVKYSGIRSRWPDILPIRLQHPE